MKDAGPHRSIRHPAKKAPGRYPEKSGFFRKQFINKTIKKKN
jgi:hypothetical protein